MTKIMPDEICVLIVEDEPLVSEMLVHILDAMGYCVAGVATNGRQALEMTQSLRPDVILMDIGLAEMDGIEATRAIQDVCPTPVVILTAYDDRETLARATKAGVGAFLTKPMNPASLKNALTTVIARFNDMMELHRLNVELQREIGARKQVEEERARLLEDLEKEVAAQTTEIATERDKTQAILRSAGDAIAVLNTSLLIEYVNPAFEQLTGYTTDECLNKVVHRIMKSQLSDRGIWAMQEAYRTATEWQGEIVLYRKDGRAYDAAMAVSPIRDSDGTVWGYVVSHQDISRFKALERARNQFITSISHELRTPLTILDLSVRRLRQHFGPEGDRGTLDAMSSQIKHLTRFTEDILEMTALDSGKGVRVWEPVHVASLVMDTSLRYQGVAASAGVTLTALPVASSLPSITGDPKRIAQMLAEIVENAVTFTPAGGRITLEVRAEERGERMGVAIAVTDTGPGILEEEIDRVFDRFFRGHLAESGHVLGTGLGLSIAQEIARAHGGLITVESTVGTGSTFTIWLPGARA